MSRLSTENKIVMWLCAFACACCGQWDGPSALAWTLPGLKPANCR
jgi:hypothetical protein